jgi:hypothetical protein
MSTPRLPRLALATLRPAILLGCAAWSLAPSCWGGNRLSRWEEEQLVSRTNDDLDALLDEAGDTGGGLDAASAARATWSDCYAGYAGCQRCYEAEGNDLGGTISMELTGVPCSASLTVDDVMYEYTVALHTWDGSWVKLEDERYDVEWSGSRAAELLVEGSESYDGTYDSSWTMEQATAITDGDGNLYAWTVDYTYSGFLDRTWDVSVQKDEGGAVSGSITSDDGVNCTVSGQDYDYVIDCD